MVAVDRARLDITDAEHVDRVVAAARPDAVVNGAAFTAVDRCETEVDAAYDVNAHGVRVLATACRDVAAHLVQISTDYVFDGTLDRPYREDDPTNPQSVYGRSKLAGEQAALDVLGDDVTIVRTSWVCGEHGNNMVKLVRRLAATGNPMSFVDDQRGCPTFTADLAPALRALAVERPGGVVPPHQRRAGLVVRLRPGDPAWRRGRTPTSSARSRPPSWTRPGRRHARRTACSTTHDGSPTDIRRLRDFRAATRRTGRPAVRGLTARG